MGFSRQEYWSGLPLPSPEDLPDPGIEPGSPALQVDALLSELKGHFSLIFMYMVHLCQGSMLISEVPSELPPNFE